MSTNEYEPDQEFQFTLEDIVREFGSEAAPKAPEPLTAAQDAPAPDAPQPPAQDTQVTLEDIVREFGSDAAPEAPASAPEAMRAPEAPQRERNARKASEAPAPEAPAPAAKALPVRDAEFSAQDADEEDYDILPFRRRKPAPAEAAAEAPEEKPVSRFFHRDAQETEIPSARPDRPVTRPTAADGSSDDWDDAEERPSRFARRSRKIARAEAAAEAPAEAPAEQKKETPRRLRRDAQETEAPSTRPQRRPDRPSPADIFPDDDWAIGDDDADDAPETARRPLRLPQLPQRKPAPVRRIRSAEEIVRDAGKQRKLLELRLRICLVVTVVGALLALYEGLGLSWIGGLENLTAVGAIMLVLLLAAAASCYDILLDGFRQLMSLRPELSALLDLTILCSVVESVFAMKAGRLPFCTVVSLELLAALWSRTLQQQALFRSAKVACRLDAPVGVQCAKAVYEKHDGLFCTDGSADDFAEHLDDPDLPAALMRLYVPIVMLLTLLLAIVAAITGKVNFFWIWTALLIVSAPIMLFICFTRPFALLSARLSGSDAALCGWYGAQVHTKTCTVLIKDRDLFPEGSVHLSGVKAFEGYTSGRVLGYAAGMLEGADSALFPILEDAMRTEGARRQMAENLRRYDREGLGADFGSDSALVGTIAFMKKMGVHMSTAARVRHAIYIAVNGELAGLIAVKYETSSDVRRGLQMFLRSGKLRAVMASPDILVTPQVLRGRFKMDTKTVRWPSTTDCLRLSQLTPEDADTQTALMGSYHFGTFADVTVGGRLLRLSVLGGIALSALSVLVGLVIVFILGKGAAFDALSCDHMLSFAALWGVPALLLSGWTRRY